MTATPSSLWAFAFRLTPKADLKKSIVEFAVQNKILAGSIITCVGSLEQTHIRFANKENGVVQTGFFEIVSLSGTFSPLGCHMHISVSDGNGNTVGGHLLDENIVFTTTELIVADLSDLSFERELDSTYGYQELSVIRRKRNL